MSTEDDLLIPDRPPRQPVEHTGVRSRSEFIIELLIRITGISAIVIIALIFLFLLKEGLPAFREVSIEQFLGSRWYPIDNQ